MRHKRVVSLIMKEGLTLAVAESCTGGLICHYLTTIPGVSGILKEGIICYSNSSKIKRLKIPAHKIRKYGAVSPEICHLMAKNIIKSESADLGLATTGIAGPSGGTPNKPVGLVYIGINFKGKTAVYKYNFTGQRNTIRQKASKEAFLLLGRTIEENAK